ncbi:Glutamate--cysteine ligase regulatory subunit [Sarcoptes scabiei]|uniref:GCS light chain n=1 Tax=Sarcoptes scabiei TaxID=52283 RepID=A0A834VEG8_SARSC|nr:Glutamate--cysteine ligase regulatory subunit [Sarcoptes scabiei]
MPLNEKTIIIDSGNVFSCGLFDRNILQDPRVEITRSFEKCSESYQKSSIDWKKLKIEENDLEIDILRNDLNSNHNGDANGSKLSIKLFIFPDALNRYSNSDSRKLWLGECVASILKLLNRNQIDTLILSIQTKEPDQVVTILKSFWPFLESLVMEKKICSIGVSDLTYNQLSDLYDHAEHIKPSLTQINLESCCDIPEDLSKFAKTNSITVLTHNDTSEILQMDKIQNFLSNDHSNRIQNGWLDTLLYYPIEVL